MKLARRFLDAPRTRRRPRARLVRYRTVSAFLADYDQNLSRGSVFVNAREVLREGSRVTLTIALGRTSLRNIEGRVTRAVAFGNEANEAPGMYVQLADGRRLERIASQLREVDPTA